MRSIPREFDPQFVSTKSTPEMQMYQAENSARGPMKSVLENNPELYNVKPTPGAAPGTWEFKPGSWYDTTTGARHPAWRDQPLPQPSKDIEQLRRDMLRWGYCLVEEAVADDQVAIIKQRVEDQARGEHLAGIAFATGWGQNINCLVNKGRCFELLVEQHPDIMQGGALVEQLITEAVGPRWICTSMIASLALKGGMPQALHHDQICEPGSRSPYTVNVMVPLCDVDERNGGTLLIPGSHLTVSRAARENRPVDKLPPAINLDAKAGTAVITDGRLVHGTGINHTDTPRMMVLAGFNKPWMRQQENWMLSLRPDVLERASAKLLHRLGYQASNVLNTNEGHGFSATGMPGEAAGALAGFRQADDRGEYLRIGELSPQSSQEELDAPFTLREVAAKT